MVSKGAGWAVSHLKGKILFAGVGPAECDIKMQIFVGGELSVSIYSISRVRGHKKTWIKVGRKGTKECTDSHTAVQ